MNSTNKKAPGARGTSQPFKQQAGHAPQIKPGVAQPKTAVSAQSVKQPVAPPLYRPQQTPKVLQTKSSSAHNPQSGHAPRQPVAPPVYRPEAKKIVQPKTLSPQRKPPTAPPVYRPQQPRVAQPKMASAAPAHMPPKSLPVGQAKMAMRPLRPASVAQMWGVIQRDLAADLKTKKINVAIVGERHDEINVKEEIGAWKKAGINVFYEADAIPHSGQSSPVIPDPFIMRLAFAWTFLAEKVIPYLDQVAKSGSKVDESSLKNVDEGLKYLLSAIKGDMRELNSPALKEAMNLISELEPLLNGDKSKSLSSEQEGFRVMLAMKVRRDLKLVDVSMKKLHAESKFSKVDYNSEATRIERSRQMLGRINHVSGEMEKTIYKVGNDHVIDMRREGWPVKPAVKVYSREEYHQEYQSLKQKRKKIKPSQPQISSSSSSSVPKLPEGKPQQQPSPPKQLLPPPSLSPSSVSKSQAPSLSLPLSPNPSKLTPPSSSAQKPSLISTPVSSKSATVLSPPIIINKPPQQSPVPTIVKTNTNKPPTQSSISFIGNKSDALPSHSSQQPPKKKVIMISNIAEWIPDDHRPKCVNCNAEFGFFKRRHHCRVCGEVFCSDCCFKKRKVSADIQVVENHKPPTNDPVLVCNTCF